MKFKVIPILATLTLAALTLAACEAPPSVQKVIDEQEAQKAEREGVKMDDPVLNVAREDGIEMYNRQLIGAWAPKGRCDAPAAQWIFTEDSFARPDERACSLAVVESLEDGSYAIAGFCPRVETQDEAEVITFTRTGADAIIIPGNKGGPLVKC